MKLVIFFFLVVVQLRAIGQDSIWFEQTKVGQAIAFERSLLKNVIFLDQNIGLGKGFYPLTDKYQVGNPVIAKRLRNNSLPLYVEYFFTPKDSVIRLVSYDWEKDKFGNLFDKQKIWESEVDSLDLYNGTYEEVLSTLTKKFGSPTVTDKSPKLNQSDRGDYLTRKSAWDLDNMYIELSMVFESMTYRVRMDYYWKD